MYLYIERESRDKSQCKFVGPIRKTNHKNKFQIKFRDMNLSRACNTAAYTIADTSMHRQKHTHKHTHTHTPIPTFE